jgi:nicotinamidase-related amidase
MKWMKQTCKNRKKGKYMNDVNKMALLVMDVQQGIVDRMKNKDEYLKNIGIAVETARKNMIPVIFVVVGFRPGFPEINPKNKSFGRIKASPSAGMVNPVPYITPVGNDVVVTKRRVSAFSGSDLEVILRSMDVSHLVLAGIATGGVVLSTTREAADKDYQITILSDLCADMDPEVHKVLLEKIPSRQAEVKTSEDWMKSL